MGVGTASVVVDWRSEDSFDPPRGHSGAETVGKGTGMCTSGPVPPGVTGTTSRNRDLGRALSRDEDNRKNRRQRPVGENQRGHLKRRTGTRDTQRTTRKGTGEGPPGV